MIIGYVLAKHDLRPNFRAPVAYFLSNLTLFLPKHNTPYQAEVDYGASLSEIKFRFLMQKLDKLIHEYSMESD